LQNKTIGFYSHVTKQLENFLLYTGRKFISLQINRRKSESGTPHAMGNKTELTQFQK
jgi:hypothetical protein